MREPGPELLRWIIDQYGPRLVLYARQWCSVPEDVVQDALLKLFQQRQVPKSLVPWLFRVVRNGAIAAGRARQLQAWFRRVLVEQWREIAKGEQPLVNWDAVIAMLHPRVEGDRLVLNLDSDRLLPIARQTIREVVAQAASQEARSANNLKWLSLAMHRYYDVHAGFPAPASFDEQGRPLLSWRVQLLPYLDQAELYAQFRQDEPWDSEHNRQLIAKMPEFLRSPASQLPGDSGKTSYLLPIIEGGAFEKHKAYDMSQLTDGTSNTLMLVEASDAQAVIWTKPDDWMVDAKDPTASLAGQYPNRFYAATCDGAVRALRLPIDPDSLLRLLLRADGQPVDLSQLTAPAAAGR